MIFRYYMSQMKKCRENIAGKIRIHVTDIICCFIYSGRSWQTDLKYSRAQHDVAYADGSGKQSVDFRTYTLTISYNIDVTKSLRLFAGAGVGYGKAEGPYNSDTSIFPALTLGGTWALTDHFWLTGSMDTNLVPLSRAAIQ